MTQHTSTPQKTAPQVEKSYKTLRPILIAAISLIFSFFLIDAFTPAFESHRSHKTRLSQIGYVLSKHETLIDPALLTPEENLALTAKRRELENVESSFFPLFKKGLVSTALPSPLNLSLSLLLLVISLSFLRFGPYRKILQQQYLAKLSLLAPALVLLSFFIPSLLVPIKSHLFPPQENAITQTQRRTFFPTERQLMDLYQYEGNSVTRDSLSQLWNRYLIDLYRKQSPLIIMTENSTSLEVTDSELLTRAQAHYFKQLALLDLSLPPVVFFPKNLWLVLLFFFTLFWSLSVRRHGKLIKTSSV